MAGSLVQCGKMVLVIFSGPANGELRLNGDLCHVACDGSWVFTFVNDRAIACVEGM